MENWMKPSKNRINAKKSSAFWSSPAKGVRKKNLSYSQAKIRYPKLKPFGDRDKDGVKNIFDCKPFNRKKQGWAHRGHTFQRERSSHVVMMSPDKFMRTAYREAREADKSYPDKMRGMSTSEQFEKNVIDRKNVEKLKKIIKSSKGKMEVPFLEYDEQGRPMGHEGRHRAVAARELGIKKIPVTIAKRLKQPRDWKKIRKVQGYKEDERYDLENEDEIVSSKSADVPISEQREYGEEKPEVLADA